MGECVGEAKYLYFAANSKHKIENNIVIEIETRKKWLQATMLLDLADMQGKLKPLLPKFKKNEQVTIHILMTLFAVVILLTST